MYCVVIEITDSNGNLKSKWTETGNMTREECVNHINKERSLLPDSGWYAYARRHNLNITMEIVPVT